MIGCCRFCFIAANNGGHVCSRSCSATRGAIVPLSVWVCDPTVPLFFFHTLSSQVVSRRTGAFKLRVIVAKDNVKELVHAADVCVQEGPTAAARSFLMGHWPPSGPVAGIPAGFVIQVGGWGGVRKRRWRGGLLGAWATVVNGGQRWSTQACDEHGNSATKGGSRFLVDIAGMPAHAIAVTDRGDGSYAVQYTVPSEGNYRVNVTLDGSHVQGSPTSLTAFRCAPFVSVFPSAHGLVCTIISVHHVVCMQKLHLTLLVSGLLL